MSRISRTCSFVLRGIGLPSDQQESFKLFSAISVFSKSSQHLKFPKNFIQSISRITILGFETAYAQDISYLGFGLHNFLEVILLMTVHRSIILKHRRKEDARGLAMTNT